MGDKGKAPKPDADNGALDNNKRLEFLEEQTALLAIAASEAKGEEVDAANPFDVAIEGLACARFRGEQLNILAAAIIESDLGSPEDGEQVCDTAARLLLAKAEAKPIDPDVEGALTKRIVDLEGEVMTLSEDLAKAETAAAAAGKASAPAPREKARSVRARKVCPGARSPDVKAAIEAAMALGGPLEIVISDGKNEIIDFAPLEVTGASFTRNSRGWALTKPFQVKGSGTEHKIRGFGLFHDGRQIAFAPLASADSIGPGVIRAYQSQVVF